MLAATDAGVEITEVCNLSRSSDNLARRGYSAPRPLSPFFYDAAISGYFLSGKNCLDRGFRRQDLGLALSFGSPITVADTIVPGRVVRNGQGMDGATL